MNLVDVIIILLLGLGLVSGLKKGFFKTSISLIGFIIIVILAWMLKTPIGNFLCNILPFFDFAGAFKGVTSLNILMYQLIGFFIVFSILSVILELVLAFTTIFEKILNATIILGIPSKILGAIIGLIQAYVVIFFILFILNQPSFELKMVNDSKLNNTILNKTPVLKSIVKNVSNTFDEIFLLKNPNINDEQLNKDVLDILLKHKVTNVNTVESLIDKGKLKISGVDDILRKYR